MTHPIPKDGTILNGAFWIKGKSWLITDPRKPLKELLVEQLKDQRSYIDRLTKRADALEEYLEAHPQL